MVRKASRSQSISLRVWQLLWYMWSRGRNSYEYYHGQPWYSAPGQLLPDMGCNCNGLYPSVVEADSIGWAIATGSPKAALAQRSFRCRGLHAAASTCPRRRPQSHGALRRVTSAPCASPRVVSARARSNARTTSRRESAFSSRMQQLPMRVTPFPPQATVTTRTA